MPTLTARFATDPAAGKAGIESWRSSFGHAVCELDIDPLPDGIFTADATLLAIDGFGMVTGTCSGASYSRPARLIRNDDFVFVINHEGELRRYQKALEPPKGVKSLPAWVKELQSIPASQPV